MHESEYEINEGEDGIICIEPKNAKQCNMLDRNVRPLSEMRKMHKEVI